MSALGGEFGFGNGTAGRGAGGSGGLGRIRMSLVPERSSLGGTIAPALADGATPTAMPVLERVYIDVYPF
ncbi:MAG: hypothetical protein KC586_19175 [Myxococcales bacterium]|nr:hypothetical protein [Myxococcales bacterium]